MRKRLAVAMLLATATIAKAQPLPAPQFSMPAASDNSARAATTAWVNGQGYIGPNGNASAAIVTVPNGSVTRTLAARLSATFNVLDYGAVADGATDVGPALRTIAGLMAPGAQNRIVFPAGSFALKSAVVFNGVAPILEGDGFTAGPGPSGSTGTWITISGTGYTPFTLTGVNARGAVVRNIAFTEVQPVPAAGWQPTAYDYVFRVQSTLGEVTFDNVLMSGVTLGIYDDNSGRLDIKSLLGQFFTNAVTIDDCYDIPRLEHLHAWPYWSSNTNVEAWQNANLNAVTLKRVDGIFIGNLFSFTGYSALYLTTGANGVTTKLYADDIYADQVRYGVLVDANGANGQFSKVTTQHNDVVAGGGAIVAGSRGMLLTGSTEQFQIGAWRTNSVGGSAIDIEGSNNRVTIDDLWANTFWTSAPGDGTPAIKVADTAASGLPANFAEVRGSPFLQGVSPLYLFNQGTNGGRSKTTQMNSICGGSPCNEVRTYDNTAGNPVTVAAIGSDASVDLQLQSKSNTGSVRLQAAGQTVLRADNANTSADDLLVRGGTGALNLALEGGDASIDLDAIAKGPTGGVRLQANGATTVRTDNPNSGNTDLLLRPGSGSFGLVTEAGGGTSDLTLAALGASGGVKMLANGGVTLRTDNPNGGTSDLLVRSGPGVVALTVEDPGANANLTLNPKGTGTVIVGTVAAADNSTNAASTAWVRSYVGGGGQQSSTANVTLTGTTTISLRSGGRLVAQGTAPGAGSANIGSYLLVASTSAPTAARLTTDGNAPSGTNCINPAANTAISASVDITGIDTTSGTAASRARFLDVLMLRGATASATTIANGAVNSAANGTIGSAAATFSVAADTTNGCLSVSVTPPNADVWHWAARITTTEVQ